jgi:hypothetical protein
MRRERQRGQSAVETVGVAIVLAFLTLVGWQAVVAAYAWQTAHSAAHIAARAGSVGAPVERAALTVLPNHLATRAMVTSTRGADGRRRVRVQVRVPRVLPGRGGMGAVVGVGQVAP